LSEGGSIVREAGDKFRLKNIEVIGPAKVAQIPDYLGAGLSRGANDGENRGKIITAWRGFDQMPADPFACNADAQLLQALIILLSKGVMAGCGDQIQTLA
jgi:hypothetical protein